jgi:hypothetical protein
MDGNIIYADSFHRFSFHAPGYKVFPCGSLIKTWSNIVNKALEMEPNETKHVHWAPKKKPANVRLQAPRIPTYALEF